MSRLALILALLVMPCLMKAQSIDNPTSIDYTAQIKNLSGRYELTYNKSLVASIRNVGQCRFDFFSGDTYVIKGNDPAERDVFFWNMNGEEYALFNYKGNGPSDAYFRYNIKNVAMGLTTYTNEAVTNECKLDGQKHAIDIVSKGKFDDSGIKSISTKADGVKFNTKIEYTDIMYLASFDYMTFILYNFLGVLSGYFEFWPLPSIHPMYYYPKTIENNGIKYTFDYNFSQKDSIYIEVKMTRGKTMEERYTFKVNK